MSYKEPYCIANLVEKPDCEYSRILRAFTRISMPSQNKVVTIKEIADFCSDKSKQLYVKRFKLRFAEMCQSGVHVTEPIFQLNEDGIINVHFDQQEMYEKYRNLLSF